MPRKKKATYFKENINRFKRFRYADTDDLTDAPSLTVDDIVKKTGLSKGQVSKMESMELDSDSVPNCNASTLKAYHDAFGCTYDYLMGESQAKSVMYNTLGKDPVLGKLNDDFWDNLKKSLTDEWSNPACANRDRITILRLLLSNPESFSNLLDTIFNSLFEISKIRKAPLPDYLKEDNIGQREYALDRCFNQFLENNVLPHLDLAFATYEKELNTFKTHEDEIMSDFSKGFQNFMDKNGEGTDI